MSFPQPLRAVITGAGSGLGRTLALDLAQRGASLLVSDIVLSTAEETAELLRQQGAKAEAVRCDGSANIYYRNCSFLGTLRTFPPDASRITPY